MSILKGLPLLAYLPEGLLDELAGTVVWLDLGPGEVLFSEGDPGDALYAVKSGEVKVFVVDDEGREQVYNHLGPGQGLGEMSIIDAEERTASVAATTATEVLRLGRDDFMEVVAKYPAEVLDGLRETADRMRLGYTDVLKRIALLEDLPDETLARIAERLEPVRFDEGEHVFQKGDAGNSLYIIDSGLVKIVSQDDLGHELVLNQCGPGQAIGEMSLIDEEPRSAGVVAISPTVTMLKLGREDFIEALTDEPQLSLSVMRYLSRRLRFNTTYLEESQEWLRRVAEGEYDSTVDRITSERDQIRADDLSDEALANEFLSDFVTMISSVKEREEELKTQLRRLTIEIDEAKRKQDFESLTNTEFFTDLKAAAQKMREEDTDG